MISAQQVTSASEMLANYAAIRRRLMTPQVVKPLPDLSRVVEVKEEAPEEVIPIATVPAPRDFIWIGSKEIADEYEASLAGLRSVRHNVIRCGEIIARVCALYGVSRTALLSDRRLKELVQARQHAWWLIKRDTTWSYPQIGRKFGRDHTTVLYGIGRFQQLVDAGQVEP